VLHLLESCPRGRVVVLPPDTPTIMNQIPSEEGRRRGLFDLTVRGGGGVKEAKLAATWNDRKTELVFHLRISLAPPN
jgi:hypothetical protein